MYGSCVLKPWFPWTAVAVYLNLRCNVYKPPLTLCIVVLWLFVIAVSLAPTPPSPYAILPLLLLHFPPSLMKFIYRLFLQCVCLCRTFSSIQFHHDLVVNCMHWTWQNICGKMRADAISFHTHVVQQYICTQDFRLHSYIRTYYRSWNGFSVIDS